MTTFAASVTIVDLPVANTLTGAELFEAVQTSGFSTGQSVQVSLNAMKTAIFSNFFNSTVTFGAGIVDNTTFALAKTTPIAAAPGAGFCIIQAVAGTIAGTCKIIIYAGTSSTAVTIVDNVGTGF